MSCDLGWDHAPPEGCQRAWGHVLERVELLWVISTPSVNSMTKDSPTVLRILFVNWIWVNDHPRKAGEFDCTARRAMIHKFMLILWSCVDTLETLSYFAVCSGRSNPSTMFFTQKMYSRLKYDWVCRACMYFQALWGSFTGTLYGAPSPDTYCPIQWLTAGLFI